MVNFKFKPLKYLAIIVLCLMNASCRDAISCGFLNQDEVCVNVLNQSGTKIKSLQIFYKQGSEEVVNIDTESKATITFKIRGESGFTLKAKLDGNRTVESRENYIEGGYQRSAVVLSDTITINQEYK